MIEALIIAAAGGARFLQGNGYGGPGRWLMLPVMLAAGFFGPMDGAYVSFWPMTPILFMALAGWATVALGYTDWADWKYGLVRYTGAPAVASIVAAIALQNEGLVLYALVGPVLTAIYYFVAQHKPAWITTSKDVAAALAGVTVGTLVLF